MEKFMFIFRGGNTHISTANSQAAMDIIQTWNDWMQGLAEKLLKPDITLASSEEKFYSF